MKRTIGIISGLIVLAGLFWTVHFHRQYFRGAGIAVSSPPQALVGVPAPQGEPGSQAGVGSNTTGLPLKLPPGFSISIFAKNLGTARVLALDPAGNLLVSIPSQGRVAALPDRNRDGVSDGEITVAAGLNRPHGLAFRREKQGVRLYIAEVEQVSVYDYDEKTLRARNKRKIIDLPPGGSNWTRSLLFMPPPQADRLLISVGSPGDAFVEKDWRYAKILATDPDGGGAEIFASGLLNASFMTVHPETGRIWATEMGREFLGDDLAPDEINIVEEGKHYGWPYCYGKRIHDDKFDPTGEKINLCKETVPSHIDIPAHSAPLGLAFFPKEGWPQQYHDNLLVAYHGSWNRLVPSGYKVVRFKLDARGNYLGEEDFITGWFADDRVLGQPVDILIRPDGVMYISDDKAGVVYRVSFKKEN